MVRKAVLHRDGFCQIRQKCMGAVATTVDIRFQPSSGRTLP
jgi:hypothetical protein